MIAQTTPPRARRGFSILALATAIFAALPSGHAALMDDLVSHWPLDADTGGVTPDVIFENHLSITGVPAIVPGMIGNAFAFDGSTTYLGIQHSTDRAATGLPIFNPNGYTIAFWVRGTPQTAKYLFTEASTASNTPLLMLQTGQPDANNGKLDLYVRNDGNAVFINHRVSTTTVFDGNWHHVVWTDNNGTATLYIDGLADATDFNYTPDGSFTFNTTAIGTLIRANVATGGIFTGEMDEVAIWDRALTADEALELMANGVPGNTEVVAPSLNSQPADATKQIGDWHEFTLDLSGTRPFTFQWFRNGEAIPGETSQSLFLSGLTEADSGDTFHATISNSAGEVSTTPATLTVLPDPAPDVSAGLINYWPLDETVMEGELLTTPDLYSGNDMVLKGYFDPADFLQPGMVGNALFFDFVGHYAYRTNGSPIYNNPAYSIAFWVKGPFANQADRRVFAEGSDQSNTPLFAMGVDPVLDATTQQSSPAMRIFIRDDANASAEINPRRSTRPVFDDSWHHVVWTDDNGLAKLYVDGVLDETDFTYTRGTLTLNQTSLGAVLRAADSHHFFGNMDEVATWNRVLSHTEIQSILNDGIPAPTGAVPPAITTQPVHMTNNIFQGDTVTFLVQASGSEPLTYQWLRNGVAIPAEENASALTPTLVLANVQPEDSAVYSVTISNEADTVTSEEAELLVAPYTPALSGTALNVDIGPSLQEGFDQLTLANNGTRIGGVRVTLSGIEAALAERNRTTGNQVVNNPPDLTLAQVYNDFIFANSSTDGTGMRILIENLAANTPYELTLWSFDPHSNPERISNWSEVSSGVPVEIQTSYTFNGNILPVSDEEARMTALVTSSAEGTLQIEGLRNGGSSVAVFLNGIRLVANPGSAPLEVTATELAADNLVLTVQLQSEDQVVTIEQTENLADGAWVEASGGIIERTGSTLTAEFPANGPRMFYRVVSNP